MIYVGMLIVIGSFAALILTLIEQAPQPVLTKKEKMDLARKVHEEELRLIRQFPDPSVVHAATVASNQKLRRKLEELLRE